MMIWKRVMTGNNQRRRGIKEGQRCGDKQREERGERQRKYSKKGK